MASTEKVTTAQRFGTLVIDFMMLVFTFFILIFTVGALSNDPPPTHSLEAQEGRIIWFALLTFFLYFIKDIFGSASLGKRAMKYVLVDSKTGRKASPLQTVVRNATLFLWPIEFIVALVSPAKRGGDLIARTKLVVNKHVFPRKQPLGNLLLPVALALGAVLALGAETPLRNTRVPAYAYLTPAEDSYDAAASQNLGRVIIEELFNDVNSVDVKLYNKTSEPDTRFVSVIVYVFSDFYYLFDAEIKKNFTDKIKQKLDANSLAPYKARIQYVYYNNGDLERKEFTVEAN